MSEERREHLVKLLSCAEDGELDALDCPSCKRAAVSVWFTNPIADAFLMWFLCERCDFELRVQCSGKPKHFSPARIHHPKELYDRELLSKVKFPHE